MISAKGRSCGISVRDDIVPGGRFPNSIPWQHHVADKIVNSQDFWAHALCKWDADMTFAANLCLFRPKDVELDELNCLSKFRHLKHGSRQPNKVRNGFAMLVCTKKKICISARSCGCGPLFFMHGGRACDSDGWKNNIECLCSIPVRKEPKIVRGTTKFTQKTFAPGLALWSLRICCAHRQSHEFLRIVNVIRCDRPNCPNHGRSETSMCCNHMS